MTDNANIIYKVAQKEKSEKSHLEAGNCLQVNTSKFILPCYPSPSLTSLPIAAISMQMATFRSFNELVSI